MRYISMLLVTGLLLILACNGQQAKPAVPVQIDDEIIQLKKQIEVSPQSPSLHSQLSALLAAKGDWDGFEKEINTAMRLDPHDPMLCVSAAQVYQGRGMSPKALEMLNRGVAIDPDNPLSHFFLGVMYQRQSDSEKAMAEFHEARRLIDTLSAPTSSTAIHQRIVRGARGETYYRDLHAHEYLLDDILGFLKKKLSNK